MKKYDKLTGKDIFECNQNFIHSLPEPTIIHSIPFPKYSKVKLNKRNSNKKNYNPFFEKINSNKPYHVFCESSDKIKLKDTTIISRSLRIKYGIRPPRTPYLANSYEDTKISKNTELNSASTNIIINENSEQKRKSINKKPYQYSKKCLSVENNKKYSNSKNGYKKYKEKIYSAQSHRGINVFNSQIINTKKLRNKISKQYNIINNNNFSRNTFEISKNNLSPKSTSFYKKQKIPHEKKQNKLKISVSKEEKSIEENILSTPNTYAYDHHYQKRNKSQKEKTNNEEKKNQEDNQSSSNVELSQKTEEKITILIPGQTVEKKNVSEVIEDPIEEVIQYPDGTTSVIIKQTKITKVVENFPIEVVEKNNPNGKKLPAVKQVITYYYKTVQSEKDAVFNTQSDFSISNENEDNKNNDNSKEIDKQKNIDYYKYLYKNSSYNEEEFFENLMILCNHLSSMNEIDRKEILNELYNMEPKNEQLYEKLLELIKKKEINNTNTKSENVEQKNNDSNKQKIKNSLRKNNSKKLNEIKTRNNKQQKFKKDNNIFKDNKTITGHSYKKKLFQTKMLEKFGKTSPNKNIRNRINIQLKKKENKNSKDVANTKLNGEEEIVKKEGKNIKVVGVSDKLDSGVDKYFEKLKMKGLLDDDFFDHSKYPIKNKKEKNPFDGPSKFDKFYKDRTGKIKEKLNN